jgi:hypothetical protein
MQRRRARRPARPRTARRRDHQGISSVCDPLAVQRGRRVLSVRFTDRRGRRPRRGRALDLDAGWRRRRRHVRLARPREQAGVAPVRTLAAAALRGEPQLHDAPGLAWSTRRARGSSVDERQARERREHRKRVAAAPAAHAIRYERAAAGSDRSEPSAGREPRPDPDAVSRRPTDAPGHLRPTLLDRALAEIGGPRRRAEEARRILLT